MKEFEVSDKEMINRLQIENAKLIGMIKAYEKLLKISEDLS